MTDNSDGEILLFFKEFSETMSCRLVLAKVPLCLLIGCSTVFGYVLADPIIAMGTLLTGLGLFVLATGAATLNSLQEYRLDGELERTKNRPLPKGLIAPRQAGTQALVLLIFGLLILFAATKTIVPVLAAIFAVLLYNGVYTPLKKRTILAIIPGAVCGALPPYIGWLGGGGGAVNYTAVLLIALFVLWQIPHFWLVLLNFKEDYGKSNLPNLLKLFQEDSLKRFFVTWVGALVLVMLMFLSLPSPLGSSFRIAIVVNGCCLLIVFAYVLAIQKTSNYRFLFIVLNVALLLHMIFLAAGRISAKIL
ncbi:MAG: UbiA family prenyltransferase [Desulfobulbaceae bacterium]|nr:UbiA family prenyltransferase [Desulfobulbaceae bacterium]